MSGPVRLSREGADIVSEGIRLSLEGSDTVSKSIQLGREGADAASEGSWPWPVAADAGWSRADGGGGQVL